MEGVMWGEAETTAQGEAGWVARPQIPMVHPWCLWAHCKAGARETSEAGWPGSLELGW